MNSHELRQLKVNEIKEKVRQWREELFKSRFVTQPSESRDTSVFKKLRRNIARALTILREKELTFEAGLSDHVQSPSNEVDGAVRAKTTKQLNRKKTKVKKLEL